MRKRMRPSNVEKAQAVSMYQCRRSCGDSCTSEILCKLQTASIFGNMHVLIINASMWTATRSVVQMANATNISVGTLVSLLICTSTIATCGNKYCIEQWLNAWNQICLCQNVQVYVKVCVLITIANPDRRADVLLDAFNLARLSCSFLHDR